MIYVTAARVVSGLLGVSFVALAVVYAYLTFTRRQSESGVLIAAVVTRAVAHLALGVAFIGYTILVPFVPLAGGIVAVSAEAASSYLNRHDRQAAARRG